MTSALEEAHLRVARARQHLTALDSETADFIRRQPFRYKSEFEPQSGHVILRARRTFEVPRRLGLLAGDAVHNIRSALDHVVYELATIGSGRGRSTSWPVFLTRDEYRRQERRLLEGVSDPYRRRIERPQPYHARGAIPTATVPEDLAPS